MRSKEMRTCSKEARKPCCKGTNFAGTTGPWVVNHAQGAGSRGRIMEGQKGNRTPRRALPSRTGNSAAGTQAALTPKGLREFTWPGPRWVPATFSKRTECTHNRWPLEDKTTAGLGCQVAEAQRQWLPTCPVGPRPKNIGIPAPLLPRVLGIPGYISSVALGLGPAGGGRHGHARTREIAARKLRNPRANEPRCGLGRWVSASRPPSLSLIHI